MKKITMVMYGMGTGGAELQFYELAKYLGKDNEVCVIGIGRTGSLDIKLKNAGLKCRVFDIRKGVFRVLDYLRALYCIISSKPDIILSTSHIGNLAAYVSSKFCKSKKIISMQTVSRCMARYPWLDKFIISRFDCLIAGAEDVARYLVSAGVDRSGIEVVHNWVDFEERDRLPNDGQHMLEKKGCPELIVGCIARLHPQKGHKTLIEALDFIESNAVVVIVGEGECRSNLEVQGMEHIKSGRLKFLGEVRGEKYNQILREFDIFVLPSYYEGLPRVLLDAMYVGIPIVATDVNGNKEAITHETDGLLVRAGCARSLADAINSLIKNESLRKEFSANARKNVVEKFEMTCQLEKIEDIVNA